MTRFLNQEHLLPQAEIDKFAIGIIGTGAIGSFVAMALTKMGFSKIITWDPDKIEDHNIANQIFPVLDVGKRKALATRTMVEQFSGEKITCLATLATGKKVNHQLSSAFPSHCYIVILAVDSLDVRRALVEEMKGAYYTTIIDARMGAKTYRVMAISAAFDAVTAYLSALVSDVDAVQERCGQKSIIYTVLGVAAEVCSFVHQLVTANAALSTALPEPVVFDYGTGIRLQKRIATGDVVQV